MNQIVFMNENDLLSKVEGYISDIVKEEWRNF